MKTALCVNLLLTGLAACHPNETRPDCGCDGPSTGKLNNVTGVYSNSTIVTLDSANRYTATYLISCHADLVTGKLNNKDTFVLSGTTYKPCYSAIESILIEKPGLLALTAIRKK